MLITSVAFIDGKNTRDHRASLLNQSPSCIDHCPKVPIILTQVLLLGLWVVDASVPYAGVGRWGNRSSLASKQSWASWAGRSIPQRRSSLGLKAPWRTRRSLWQRWAHWEKRKSPELWLREPSFTLQRNDRLGMSKQSVVPPKKTTRKCVNTGFGNPTRCCNMQIKGLCSGAMGSCGDMGYRSVASKVALNAEFCDLPGHCPSHMWCMISYINATYLHRPCGFGRQVHFL